MTALSPMAHRAISAAQKNGVARPIKEAVELAERGAEIAENSHHFWEYGAGNRSGWRCFDLGKARRKGDYAGFLLGEDEAARWPDGSVASFDFMFVRALKTNTCGAGECEIVTRHVVVCDVPGIGLDAKLNTDDRFCEFTEAAMLLAAWLRGREGSAG